MWFRSPPWDEPTYWALDLETGGLDAKNDPIISVGMLPIRAGVVRFAEAFSTLIRPEPGRPIRPESVRAHQLLAGDLRGAPPIVEVLAEVDRRLEGNVMLVHNRTIDVGFLKRAHQRAGVRWSVPSVVDTVDLIAKAARRKQFTRPEEHAAPSFNLAEARRHWGLPDYAAHDALIDAVSTAELFLVLRKELGAKTLRDLR